MIRQLLDILDGDLFRVIYLLGSGGGIWFWVEKWRGRARVRIKLISATYMDLDDKDRLCFEFINLGGKNTSVDDRMNVASIHLSDVYKRARYSFRAVTDDRLLEPHNPKRISFESEPGEGHSFDSYCRYKFVFTSGRSQSICMQNPHGGEISRLELEWATFRACDFHSPPKELR